jgi:hypothetical protein
MDGTQADGTHGGTQHDAEGEVSNLARFARGARPHLHAALTALRPSASTLFFLVIAVLVTAPAWIVKYPPIQDLPFHLATIRIVKSLNDPAYGLADHFVLTLGRTQYVSYYVVGAALALVVGVTGAGIALMGLYLGGTLLGVRELLRALGKDERLCLFVVPLLYNTMFILGLFPFLLGVTVMFFALATTVRWFEEPTPARGVTLAVLAFVLFFTHIFPFGLFGIAFALMFPWTRPRRWLHYGAPTVPALLALGYWTFLTEAGRMTSGALGGDMHGRKTLTQALPDAFTWITNIFTSAQDEAALITLAILAILALGLAQGDREDVKPHARVYALLPIACIILYFNTGEGYGYVWLVAQRFPILALMTGIPLLRMPKGFRGLVVTLLALLLAAGSVVTTCKEFIRFQLTEVGDFDEALEAMDPRKKVAALIFDRGSSVVTWVPFLHFGSYYQAKKGGVVQFTYAGYAHWPVDFQPDKYPPPGGGPARVRWEWTPELASARDELYPYYDYVLVRGGGFHAPRELYTLKFQGDRWQVWERVPGRDGADSPSLGNP